LKISGAALSLGEKLGHC